MCSVFVDSCGGEVEHVRLSGKAGTLRLCSRQWLDECWEERNSTAKWSRWSTWGLHLNPCLRLTVQCFLRTYLAQVPHSGSSTWTPCRFQVERTDPLHFLAGCPKRRLNRALSVLAHSLSFFECVLWCFCSLGPLFVLCYSVFLCVLCLGWSAPMQVIDWKH